MTFKSYLAKGLGKDLGAIWIRVGETFGSYWVKGWANICELFN